MPKAEDYSYTAAWDGNEILYWARVEEFPRLSFFAETKEEAIDGLRKLVAVTLTDMTTTGELPPLPKSAA